MYDALIHKNTMLDQKNDTRNDKNEHSPPIREHPNTQNEYHNESQGTQNSQSRQYDTHNGYKQSQNGYSQSYAANTKSSQLQQSQYKRPTQVYGYPRMHGHRSQRYAYDEYNQSTEDGDESSYTNGYTNTDGRNRPNHPS